MAELEFEEVYNNFKEKVWKLTSRYLASSHDREDLFQEVFLKVHRALPKFRGDSSLDTWIYRVTSNTAINYLKKQDRYKLLKNTLERMRVVKDDRPAKSEGESRFKPLEKLNPRQRMVIILHDVEDKKLEEVAKTLKIPMGTVKSNLHRGRDTKGRAGEKVPARRFAFAGALAVILVAAGIYFSLPQDGNNSIMDYVLEQEKINGSPLISYVFDY
ncbi:MAG: RNA polymerase sigma factor [Candidatus Margulisiibacteriota bacterium]|nr:RNA polymerase sigma factor [Candidatus Margulisiibacteriota bacterium]